MIISQGLNHPLRKRCMQKEISFMVVVRAKTPGEVAIWQQHAQNVARFRRALHYGGNLLQHTTIAASNTPALAQSEELPYE